MSQLLIKRNTLLVSIIITVGVVLYGIYFGYTTYQKLQSTEKELDITIKTSQEAIQLLEEDKNSRIAENKILLEENESIKDFLTTEQKKNLDLEKDKRQNERQIDTLEKLTTLDPELLKKYSKVFFLSENYNPPQLRDIEEKYKIRADKDLQILKEVAPFLQDMLDDANKDGVNLRVISAYRSFETQQQLKSGYVTTYGSGANQFSADQGYSEHQLGTTLDFGTPEVQGAYLSFEKTLAFDWLMKNAHEYGFVLSYPKGNSYYQYEPWHWRFVGRDLAEDLYDDKKSFYQLDQREIDSYLLKIFD